MSKLSITAIASLACICGGGALAQPADDSRLVVFGAGAGFNFEPYAELDEQASPYAFPVLGYTKGRLNFSGKSVAFNLVEAGPWDISAYADYRFQGYDEDDSPIFAEMDDRNGTLEAGGYIAYDMAPVTLSVQALSDVLDNHGGVEVEAKAAYQWNRGRATSVRPYAAFLFHSGDFTDYYYGVLPSEARSAAQIAAAPDTFDAAAFGADGRPAYAPGETITPVLGVSVRQALSEQWLVFGQARYEFLPDEVKDSPLVDQESRASVGIALSRVFR